MAYRTIHFTASTDGVTPCSPQDAGVQGDHGATVVLFLLDSALVSAAYRYRWEFVDGNGQMDTTIPFSLEGGETEVSVPLIRAWTAAGGIGELRLVITDPSAETAGSAQTVYSLAAHLRFHSREGAVAERVFQHGLTELIDEVHAAAATAVAATVEVGDVETGAPGSTATVTNTGTENAAVLNFVIPAGKQGEKGEPGYTAVTNLEPGMFAVSVNQDGHLILTHNSNEDPPPLSVKDGHLIYTIS